MSRLLRLKTYEQQSVEIRLNGPSVLTGVIVWAEACENLKARPKGAFLGLFYEAAGHFTTLAPVLISAGEIWSTVRLHRVTGCSAIKTTSLGRN